jgi:hypothetical protein
MPYAKPPPRPRQPSACGSRLAHRLSTIRHSSRILVIEGGACIAFDSHDQLLIDCPLYNRLWTQHVGDARDGKVDRDRGSIPRLSE